MVANIMMINQPQTTTRDRIGATSGGCHNHATPNSTRPSTLPPTPQKLQRQHPNTAPTPAPYMSRAQHPAVKLAKQHLAPSVNLAKQHLHNMPPSTWPSSSQNSTSTVAPSTPSYMPLAPGRQSRTSTNTPNCMPPSTRPSISQITFPSLLEVRTSIAFSYLGKT